MTPVAIVGGGITGLTAAFYLQRLNIPITLYEASDRVGGLIQTTCRDGFLVEHGPNTILESVPEVAALVNDLELTARCLYPAAEMKVRYVVRNGKTQRVPQSAMAAARTPLLSVKAKLRIMAEPFISRGVPADEALSEFVVRRLGVEVLDYLIDPFVGGVYAGDPGRLSVAHAFPKLHKLEQTYGSLIKGSLVGARARKKRERAEGTVSKTSARMLSFEEGLSVLPDRLRATLGNAVELGTAVRAMRPNESGWTLELATGETREHSSVLLCAPAHRVTQMKILGVATAEMESLRTVYYPPIARVAVAFPRDKVAHALDGFGVLIPKREQMNTLGILFSSSLFPQRAPEGYALLTAYLGGSRGPDVVNLTDAELLELTVADMKKLLGVAGRPVFEDVVRVPLSIPQYNVGYGTVKESIGKIEARAKGLFLAGSYRGGISVADCIAGGKAASEKVREYAGKT